MNFKRWKCFFAESYPIVQQQRGTALIQIGLIKDVTETLSHLLGIGICAGQLCGSVGICWGKATALKIEWKEGQEP